MMEQPQHPFGSNLVNLADARLGAEAIFATDDFFAPKERMLNPEPAVFIPGQSTRTNVSSRRPYAPAFQAITQVSSSSNSSFNSLQATVDKRFSNGFTLLANYTFGKSIDYGSGAMRVEHVKGHRRDSKSAEPAKEVTAGAKAPRRLLT